MKQAVETGLGRALGVGVGCVPSKRFVGIGKARGKGLACQFCGSFPPASERETGMDDPLFRCEPTPEIRRTFRGCRSQATAPFYFANILFGVHSSNQEKSVSSSRP